MKLNPWFISLTVWATAATIVWLRWSQIPQTIPVHWGAGFRPDRWGDKKLLLNMLFTPLFFILGLGLIRLILPRHLAEAPRVAAGIGWATLVPTLIMCVAVLVAPTQ